MYEDLLVQELLIVASERTIDNHGEGLVVSIDWWWEMSGIISDTLSELTVSSKEALITTANNTISGQMTILTKWGFTVVSSELRWTDTFVIDLIIGTSIDTVEFCFGGNSWNNTLKWITESVKTSVLNEIANVLSNKWSGNVVESTLFTGNKGLKNIEYYLCHQRKSLISQSAMFFSETR